MSAAIDDRDVQKRRLCEAGSRAARAAIRGAILLATLVALPAGAAIAEDSTGSTTRVSVSSGGEPAEPRGTYESGEPALSTDGRFAAFASASSTLVPGDTNGATDVFVRDNETGEISRVSGSSAGTQANRTTFGTSASISDDGRYVAFVSAATNLIAGDTNRLSDVFLHDRQAGTTERVSIGNDEAQANLPSFDSAISGNGRYVVFRSAATNLVAGDNNLQFDTFVRDTQENTTTRVSVHSSGAEGNGTSFTPAINTDGR
jgi:hypothetical protein